MPASPKCQILLTTIFSHPSTSSKKLTPKQLASHVHLISIKQYGEVSIEAAQKLQLSMHSDETGRRDHEHVFYSNRKGNLYSLRFVIEVRVGKHLVKFLAMEHGHGNSDLQYRRCRGLGFLFAGK